MKQLKPFSSKLAAIVLTLLLASCSAAESGEHNPEPGSEPVLETSTEPAGTEPVSEPDTEPASESTSEPDVEEVDITQIIVDNFSLLAQVPRPSHHEEKINAFLMDWARQMGFDPRTDESMNITFDVPATEGMENYPLVVLQGHMDMVVAVKDGKEFDPLEDPITVIRNVDANTLTADGTSLGADDGSGVSIIMAVAQGHTAHGPLRVLITTDEEDGMEGAFGMSGEWLEGVSYLINIDNETSDEVLVSTAAGDSVRATAAADYQKTAGDLTLKIELNGLLGGHSGVMIGEGRCNGIVGLATFLKELKDAGISFELASFDGGFASNVIPASAACTLVVKSTDKEAVEAQAAKYLEQLSQKYTGIEDGITFTVSETESPLQGVVSAAFADGYVRFLTEMIDGVYTMSADMEGLVESSSNLGIATLNEDGAYFSTFIRSSVAALETEILDAQLALAKECGFETESVKMADAWPYDPNSELLALTKDIYKMQNGEDIKVVAVHAGLECGTFKLLAPEVDMISIGPDVVNAHTINETLYLDSIPKLWKLVCELLVRIGSR